ncbi:MAG: ABC transporter substrate-binding protein [Sarcina sp.]
MKCRKLVALMLCAITATSVLAGCGGEKGEASASGDKNEITKLTWYCIGGEPKDLKTVVDKVNEYTGEKIGVNIDMKFVDWGDYTKKMSVLMNTGGDWDMAFTCSWAGDYLGNARKGAFLELDSYLEKEGADMYKEIDKRFWNGAKIDGKTYAVPNQKEIGVIPMWIFDKSLVDKYEIPYEDLSSMESLEPWLKVIKENEPDYIPFFIPAGSSFAEEFDIVTPPLGFRLEDNDLKLINVFEDEQLIERLKLIKKYYDAGYINADSNIAIDDAKLKKFVTKGDGQPFADRIWSASASRELVTNEITDTWITNTSTTGSMIGVNKNTKSPEKAVEFLNLLNTDEYLRTLVNYGVEDIHYNLDENDQVVCVEPKTYDVSYMSMGNLFKTKTLAGDPENKWDVFKQSNDEAKPAPSLGFKFDTAPIQNEIAAVNNVVEEYKSLLYGGAAKDVDKTVAEMNKRMEEQGLQKIKEEIQKQIDEWKTSK